MPAPTVHEALDLLLVDIDGTLTTCTVPGQPCPNGPGEQALIPAAVTALVDAWGCGCAIAAVTNQGGVALGFMTASRLDARLAELRAMLRTEGSGLTIDRVYACVHHPHRGCQCRKPRPGMLLRAIDEAGADIRRVLMVGDRDSDRIAAQAAGVRFMWAKDWHALFANTDSNDTASAA